MVRGWGGGGWGAWASRLAAFVAGWPAAQNLSQTYVSAVIASKVLFRMHVPLSAPPVLTLRRRMAEQLVCFYYVLTTFTTVGYGPSADRPAVQLPCRLRVLSRVRIFSGC